MADANRLWVRCLSALLLVGTAAVGRQAHGFSAGISSDVFGSLGCNQCHAGGNTPSVALAGPAQVLPGSTNEYTLQIAVTGSQNKGGLNVAATDGTLSVADAASTHVVTGTGGLPEITHTGAKTAASGFVTFSFLWTAPSDFTSVTLNAWGNAVNGDATSAGDRAAFVSLEITPGSPPPGGTTCADTPDTGCRKPTKAGAAIFQLKHTVGNDSKDALTWKWNKGDTTNVADFGNPVSGDTDYVLCVYDSTPTLVMTASIPAGDTCAGKPCWASTKKGFKYKDKDLTPDGVFQVVLNSGVAGKASVQVTGKGENLLMPSLPLTQSPTVTVQLKNANGVCWEADYSAPAKKNDTGQFNDKSD